MQNTLAIAGRQFRSYFNGPSAYIVAVLVLGFVNSWFWIPFFLAGRATVTQMFVALGYAMMVAAPALTMGLIAEERRSGTLEILLTMPVREAEVILGKFLGALGLLVSIVSLTIVNPIMVSTLGNLDWGPIITGYLGVVLLGAALLAVGMMTSSWTSDQLVAFFISLFLVAGIGWIGPLMLGLYSFPAWASWMPSVLEVINLQSHLESMTRGVLDTRDLIFYLSITTFGLMMAFRALESRRWS
jgi:ABC-2 type transport system permease protein